MKFSVWTLLLIPSLICSAFFIILLHAVFLTSLGKDSPLISGYDNNKLVVPAWPPNRSPVTKRTKTNVRHIAFGIAGSAKLFDHRKEYIKIWWRPKRMRGAIWVDKRVNVSSHDKFLLPRVKISRDTSEFKYEHPYGDRSAIRLTRIVSETLKMGMKNIRWFVMGDDDTFFFTDNLVRVLNKYDHTQMYYVGGSSESHYQNIRDFSYNMAYGGAGFAISYPLAKALARIQDQCINRYPKLYGSDDRIHACMAELGVPLSKEPGFHQCDLHGSLFGLLTAHPVSPIVSLHHLDLVEPIFPDMTRVQALERLKLPMELESAALMQQSFCYDNSRFWTVVVSWGYAVQIIRGKISALDIELPTRTYLNWVPRLDYTHFAFNTRPYARNSCQKPFVYYLTSGVGNVNKTETEYVLQRMPNTKCKGEDPSYISRIKVYKRPDPYLWDKSPRKNCCRVLPTDEKGLLVVDVGKCEENEVIEV